MSQSSQTKILAGNWKLNKGLKETDIFFTEWLGQSTDCGSTVFFVSDLLVGKAAESLGRKAGTSVRTQVGVQNIFSELKGAFTGETSAKVAAEAGATWTLIGHSERRTLFHETDLDVQKKVVTGLEAGLAVMICVGETLEERDTNQTRTVLKRQVEIALRGYLSLDPTSQARSSSKVAIAYEPVWAIGTGRTASFKQVRDAHQDIREILHSLSPVLKDLPILYGGSVKPDQAARDLIKLDQVGGFLVGGASLEVKSMIELHRIVFPEK